MNNIYIFIHIYIYMVCKYTLTYETASVLVAHFWVLSHMTYGSAGPAAAPEMDAPRWPRCLRCSRLGRKNGGFH